MNHLMQFTQATEADAVAFVQPRASVSGYAGCSDARVAQRHGERAAPAVPAATAPPAPRAQQRRAPDLAPILQAEDSALERSRAARELHDAVSQKLFAANLLAGALVRCDDAVVSEQARVLQQLNRGALAELRMMLFELQPEAMAPVRLPELLMQAVEALASRSGVEVSTDIDDSAPLQFAQRASVYRIATALLSNVGKHSGANRAHLQWSAPLAGQACLRIIDNGCGFHPLTSRAQPLGLARVRQRAQELNAHLLIQSAPGEGTDITLTFQRSCEEK